MNKRTVYMREYREKNREKLLKYKREWKRKKRGSKYIILEGIRKRRCRVCKKSTNTDLFYCRYCLTHRKSKVAKIEKQRRKWKLLQEELKTNKK